MLQDIVTVISCIGVEYANNRKATQDEFQWIDIWNGYVIEYCWAWATISL